jgi:hypothetical protein
MSYAIDKQGTLDLVGNSAEYEFDVGAHVYTRFVYVARTVNGSVRLRAWKLEGDGAFTSVGTEHVVGSGSRTRIVVFDNHRIVVVWLNQASALCARGYMGTANGMLEGEGVTVETTITNFDLVAVGVTTGVQQPDPDTAVYYAYRHFALTTLSANGGWKLFLGSVLDPAAMSIGPVGLGGPGDKVSVSCASVNEIVNGAHPRKALTLCRDSGQIKTRSWRVAGAGVTSLATASETKPLGIGVVHGMSIAQGNDVFATVVWPGASNETSRLQLLSLAANGSMTTYATAEIDQIPVFARLRHYGTDAGGRLQDRRRPPGGRGMALCRAGGGRRGADGARLESGHRAADAVQADDPRAVGRRRSGPVRDVEPCHVGPAASGELAAEEDASFLPGRIDPDRHGAEIIVTWRVA